MKDTRNYFEKRNQKLEQDNRREHLAEKEIKTLQIFKEITIDRILVDGTYFPYYTDKDLNVIDHVCIQGGDNKYCAIAAASILAKTERDKYVEELCEEHPELKERYGLDKNKGYGTKQHLEGIKNYGISEWHRKTYGVCKDYC